jgi:hypothetical protein
LTIAVSPEPVPAIEAAAACHLLASEIEALWALIAAMGSDELQKAVQERARRLATRLGSRLPVQ